MSLTATYSRAKRQLCKRCSVLAATPSGATLSIRSVRTSSSSRLLVKLAPRRNNIALVLRNVVHFFKVIFVHFEIQRPDIFFYFFWPRALGDGYHAARNSPVDNYLGGSLAVFSGEVRDRGELRTAGAQGGVRGDRQVVRRAKGAQVRLSEIGPHLHLIVGYFHSARERVPEVAGGEIRHADGAHRALALQLIHGAQGLL